MCQRKCSFWRHVIPEAKCHFPIIYSSQWFLLLRKKKPTDSTVITVSITTVDHEAKNRCNFSITDTSQPTSYISQKNGKVTEANTIWPVEKKIRFLIKYKHSYWPTGLQIVGFLYLYSALKLFLQFKKVLLQTWSITRPYSQHPLKWVHTPYNQVTCWEKTTLWLGPILTQGSSVGGEGGGVA